MLKSKKITVLFIVFLAVIFLLPDSVLAQTGNEVGINALENVNLAQSDLRDLIANIINIALGFLGVLAVALILYGGWVWMTSQGVATEVDRAKN